MNVFDGLIIRASLHAVAETAKVYFYPRVALPVILLLKASTIIIRVTFRRWEASVDKNAPQRGMVYLR